MRRVTKKPIFNSFSEYWYYARSLSREQRKIIFKNLTVEQKQSLDDSYLRDGWSDLFYRNEIDEKIDDLKNAYGYDVLEIRSKAIKNKSVYVPCKFWQIVEEQMNQYRPEIVGFAMAGLVSTSCEANPEVCLIEYSPNDIFD